MKTFPRLALLALASPLAALAALAPVHQNPKDLAVLVGFAHQHPQVMARLRAIDLEHLQVRFGEDCVAQFARAPAPQQPGPASPLAFKDANCPVGPAQAHRGP